MVNFKFGCMSYVSDHLSLIFKEDYSLCFLLKSPFAFLKVTGIKGTSVFTLFLISFGKSTIVAAIHKKKKAILSAADRWCPGCRV